MCFSEYQKFKVEGTELMKVEFLAKSLAKTKIYIITYMGKNWTLSSLFQNKKS